MSGSNWLAEAELRLVVADEGIGFDVMAATRRAAGEASLGPYGRAKLVHGHAEIESTPGRGTIVRTVVPLRPAWDGEAGDAQGGPS